MGELRGRPGRPVDDGRGVRGASPGRRCARRAAPRSAREWIREHGGLEATRVFTRIWLALFGEWSWDELPDDAAGDRAAAALGAAQRLRLGVLGPPDRRPAHRGRRARPVRPLPFTVAELRSGRAGAAEPPAPWRAGASSGSTGCSTATSARRSGRLRRPPCAAAAEWIIARQEADGAWGGSSRRGCTRCSPCTCSATPSTIRCCAPASRDSRASSSTSDAATASCGGSRRASRRSGTPRWP